MNDSRLSDAARKALASAEEPLLSASTLFEVSLKASLGKLDVPGEWAEELLTEGYALLPITPAHGHAYRQLPYVEINGSPLRDPFDRMLVAQAQVEGVPILTRDPGIVAHGIPTIW